MSYRIRIQSVSTVILGLFDNKSIENSETSSAVFAVLFAVFHNLFDIDTVSI